MSKLLSFFLFLSLLSLATAVEITAPPQVNSRLTDYPTWRTPIQGWNYEQLDTVTAFSVIGILFGVILAFRYELFVTREPSSSSSTIEDTYRHNSRILSTVISYYVIATLIAVVGFWILDLGKVWSTIGTLHNLLEVSTLLIMTFSSKPDNFKNFYFLIFLYFIGTEWACLVLPWPYDAIFFKFQGLATDFALIFNFYRLYRVNAFGRTQERTPLLASANEVGQSSHKSYGISNGITKIFPGHHHTESAGSATITITEESDHQMTEDLKLLIVAAIIHVFGNSVSTLSNTFFAFLIFQFSYGVSFPIYGYYVARQPQNNRLRWYDSTFASESLVAILSIALSGTIVGIGAFLTLQQYQN